MTRALDTAKIQQNSGGSVAPFIAGKNKIINGDFGIWQRGTTFSNPGGVYTADRWDLSYDGSGTTRTVSRQAFTPGAAPVSGYEASYFYRYSRSGGTNGTVDYLLRQKVEDVRTFAGQTVTVSFWAKADSARNMGLDFFQIFGTGGSSSVYVGVGTYSLTTSWQRFRTTVTIPSISGKTINNIDSYLLLSYYVVSSNATWTIDIWGVQLEAGTQATPFTTTTGSIGSELSLCKRYYERHSASSTQGYAPYAAGYFNFATAANYAYKFESEKRAQPTISFGPSVAQFQAGFNGNQAQAANTLTAANISRHGCYITLVPNGTPFTAGQATTLQDAGSAVSYIEISAEL